MTVDYATFSAHNMAPFECACGAARCRGRVTGGDHLQPWVHEVRREGEGEGRGGHGRGLR